MSFPNQDEDEGGDLISNLMLFGIAAGMAYLGYQYFIGSQANAATIDPSTGLPQPDQGLILSPTGTILPSGYPLPDASGQTVGIRNNNPGNIKWSATNNWNGQTGQDQYGFVIFSDPTYGFRAMYKILQAYQKQIDGASGVGVFDILSINAKWAPYDISSWGATVSSVSGIPITQHLNINDMAQMATVGNGIVVAENGGQYNGYYPLATIAQGMGMA